MVPRVWWKKAAQKMATKKEGRVGGRQREIEIEVEREERGALFSRGMLSVTPPPPSTPPAYSCHPVNTHQ